MIIQVSQFNSLLVISVYCSPSELIESVLHALTWLLGNSRRVDAVIMGNFNSKSLFWDADILDARGLSS